MSLPNVRKLWLLKVNGYLQNDLANPSSKWQMWTQMIYPLVLPINYSEEEKKQTMIGHPTHSISQTRVILEEIHLTIH